MITEDYVSFKTAKLLKEKGFDEKCNSFYRKILANNKLIDKEELHLAGRLFLTNNELQEKPYKQVVYCTAPTLQMAMKWLREVHKIHIVIYPYGDYSCDNYQFDVYKDNNLIVSKDDGYMTYEQACEAAIKYCLENLI